MENETIMNTGEVSEETAMPPAAAGQENEGEDLEREFEDLIKGKYKDAFTKRTQGIIDRRFRDYKTLERELEKSKSSGEDAQREMAARARLGVADEYGRLISDAEATREIYPSFDLERECKDPEFTSLVSAGVGVRRAYEAMHHDEIVKSAMQYAADRVLEAAGKRAAAVSSRPVEEAAAPQGAIDTRPDVSSLTAKEIREILKKVERGEKVIF